MTDTVVADGLSKTYGDVRALSDVSLSVAAGEVVALLGPNGAGKTTLVRALTGTTVPDAGSATLFDAAPTDVDRHRLGVLPQAFDPPGRLTPRELLQYYGGLYDDGLAVDATLERVGVADVADTAYEDLSGGQRRRTCLGITLINDPDLLVLDEPTASIDPAGRRRVRETVSTLADAGATVLLTTHDVAEAERLADRVGLLVDGELIAEGPPADLVAEHGGDHRLVVECDRPDEIDPTALRADVERVERTSAELRVYGAEVDDVGPIVDHLRADGVEPTALSWARPGLEDVYLALAGEAYDPSGSDRGAEREREVSA
jgi:ABC-2 type transport system ATP-binding protein